ncbi:MAG: acyltransferase [Flavobacteriales bacterium]|nr:acyltransferase [Flavobacteriales bacterium]
MHGGQDRIGPELSGEPMPTYLPNLNGVRFIAALTVVLSHVEQYRSVMGLPNLSPMMGVFAGFGVDIFFALSGFLITYLLIAEQRKQGSIHIGHFYMRRIFRIWPLYFLILAIGTCLELFASDMSPMIAPFNLDAFRYYLLFVPQVGKAFFLGSLCVAILWSIGVEELFYVVFPWIFRKIRKSPLRHLTVIIAVLLPLKVIAIYLLFKYGAESNSQGWIKTLAMTRFENLLVGAMVAFLALKHRAFVAKTVWAFAPILILLAAVFVLSAMKVNFYLSPSIGPILQTVVTPFIVSLCVAMLLALLVFAPRFATVMEHAWLNYLGKISYGLYVYHCLVLTLFTMLPSTVTITSWPVLLAATLGSTILLAGISYRLFERPFLRSSARYRHI